MNKIHITEEQGIKLIKAYIKEMKGIDINIVPPRDPYELQLFHIAAHHANEYFLNKQAKNE